MVYCDGTRWNGTVPVCLGNILLTVHKTYYSMHTVGPASTALILGPTQASLGDNVELSCSIGKNDPNAHFEWVAEVEGAEVIDADIISEGIEEKNSEATVNIKIDRDTGINKIRIHCIVDVEGMGEIKSAAHEIQNNSCLNSLPTPRASYIS